MSLEVMTFTKGKSEYFARWAARAEVPAVGDPSSRRHRRLEVSGDLNIRGSEWGGINVNF